MRSHLQIFRLVTQSKMHMTVIRWECSCFCSLPSIKQFSFFSTLIKITRKMLPQFSSEERRYGFQHELQFKIPEIQSSSKSSLKRLPDFGLQETIHNLIFYQSSKIYFNLSSNRRFNHRVLRYSQQSKYVSHVARSLLHVLLSCYYAHAVSMMNFEDV